MSTQNWEPRLARLEGAYEQIADRLNGIDGRLDTFEQKMDARFAQVDARFDSTDAKIDRNFRTVLGWMAAQTGVILAAIATATFTLHSH